MGNEVLHVYVVLEHSVFQTNQKEVNENPLGRNFFYCAYT